MTPAAANRQDLHNNRLCDWDTARQLSAAGRRVGMEGLMADWTTLRLNLQYHWKTVLLWSMGIGGALVLVCWLLVVRADAWVEEYQPFPDGEATVVMLFCERHDCPSDAVFFFTNTVREAMGQWNNAGADFRFRTRTARPSDDPCHLPGEVAFIWVEDGPICAGDRLRRGGGEITGRTEYLLISGEGAARVYIKASLAVVESLNSPQASTNILIPMVLHELGHVVGLGHPDEAGQTVTAVMNSDFSPFDNQLTADDIDGVQALYPLQEEPEALVGYLENPGDGSSQSGIGVISGWVCEASQVLLNIHTEGNSDSYGILASYGTERADTAYTPAGEELCGDTDNGFGLLFNWNHLGAGTHTVIAEVNAPGGWQELGRATVTVTTLDGEFPKGLSGRYVLENFPYPGESVVIEWEQSLQNFVITEKR